MKIKWRVTIALISQCILLILLYAGFTMIKFKNSVEEESSELNAKISHQTLLSFAYISDDIEGYLFNMTRTENITTTLMEDNGSLANSVLIDRFLYSITESTDYIAGAYIVDKEHDQFYGYSQLGCEMTPNEVNSKYLEGFFLSENGEIWFADEDGNVFVKREIYNGYPYKKIGYIVINISQPEFLALVGIDADTKGTMCIFSADGQMIVDGSAKSLSHELLSQAYQEGIRAPETVIHTNLDGEVYDVYTYSNQGWTVMHLIAQREKLASFYTMNTAIRVIGVFLILLSIFLASILSHSLLKNVNSMMKQIEKMGDGTLKNKRIEIRSKDEIGELANSFNELIKNLEAVNERMLVESVEKEKIRYELRDLQLRSVQAQIAPHFIGNLLGALNSYAAVGQTDKVEQLAVHASGYIRNNLKNADKKYNTLEEEFITIDDYVALYQDIFGQPESYERIYEAEECRDMLVPSMLIQPMVENSLKYCSQNGQFHKTNICLRAEHQGERLLLHIEDTSRAFPNDVLQALERLKTTGEDSEHRLGFGLTSTIRSLRLIYGEAFDFTIHQVEEYKKEIIVSIPVKWAQKKA